MSDQVGTNTFEDWSRRSPKFDIEDCVRVWKSFGGQGTGTTTIKTIFHYSQGAGYWGQFPTLPQDLFDLLTKNLLARKNPKDEISLSSIEQSIPSKLNRNENSDDEYKSRPWPKLPPEATPGWVGDLVELACRESEADPAAVLGTQGGLQFIPSALVRVPKLYKDQSPYSQHVLQKCDIFSNIQEFSAPYRRRGFHSANLAEAQ